MLESDGYTAVEADNGRVALERLRELRPAAILLDLKVEALLGDMEVFPLADAAADLYGQMKARLLAAWGPRERRARRRARLDALGVSDNDLWIAAIAKRHDFVVVSADDGFERMKEIIDLAVERWWSP